MSIENTFNSSVLIVFSFMFLSLGCSKSPRYSPLSNTKGVSGAQIYNKPLIQPGYNLLDDYLNGDNCRIETVDGQLIRELPGKICVIYPDGKHYGASINKQWVMLNKNGEILWKKNYWVHHDAFVDSNNEQIFLVTRWPQKSLKNYKGYYHDVIIGLDKKGKEVFRWSFLDYQKNIEKIIGQKIGPKSIHKGQLSHINTVQIIPENKNSSTIFAKGNILLSLFHHSLIIVISRETGDILWSLVFSKYPFKGVHSPEITKKGTIVAHLNSNLGLPEISKYKFPSSIIEIDPIGKRYVWKYFSKPHHRFSYVMWGHSQLLENNNILVTHNTNGGAAFEVTRKGEIIWEWINPKRDENGKPKFFYRVRRLPKKFVDSFLENNEI